MVSFHDNVKFHTVNNDGYFWDKPLQWLALLGRGPTINIGFWKVKTQMMVVPLVADYLVKRWDGNAPLPNPYLQPLYLAPIVPSCFCQYGEEGAYLVGFMRRIDRAIDALLNTMIYKHIAKEYNTFQTL